MNREKITKTARHSRLTSPLPITEVLISNLGSSKQMIGYFLKVGHVRFLPRPCHSSFMWLITSLNKPRT